MDRIILDTQKLDEILRNHEGEAGNIVHRFGTKIAGEAAQNAPVDTGALKNSLVSESRMKDKLTFILQDGVSYGIFQELGTSRMAAHPFVIPAIKANERAFLEAFKELFR